MNVCGREVTETTHLFNQERLSARAGALQEKRRFRKGPYSRGRGQDSFGKGEKEGTCRELC